MTSSADPNWDAIAADPRFQQLRRRKTAFLCGLMAFSIAYYFLLPIGAAYWHELFSIRVWGPVNVGLALAFSEFAVAWGVALHYSRRASAEFDRLTAAIAQDVC